MVKKEELIKLSIIPEEKGYSIYLDDKKVHHVEDYDIKQAAIPGSALLTLKMLVKFP